MFLPLIGSRRQLAAMLNVSERRLTQLVTLKVLPPRTPTGFDLTRSVRGYIAFLKSPPGGLTTSQQRTRLLNAQADLHELKVEERRGTLVRRDVANRVLFEVTRQARDSFENLPARWSGPLAAEHDQEKIFAILKKEIHQILTEMSNEKRLAS